MNKGNILVLTQWSYRDALVQTYTLPYVAYMRQALPAAYRIYVLTSEQERIALKPADVEAINQEWAPQNMELIAHSYKRFGWRKITQTAGELFGLLQLVRKKKIKVIHAFGTPAGSIAWALSKVTGAQLVIDSYEPHAEAMVENHTWTEDSMAYKLLHRMEKLQTQRASAFIATTEGMRQYAKDRFGVTVKQLYAKPACVDLDQFKPGPKDPVLLKELGLEGKIVCVYAGKLGGIYLKEEVFDFIKACYLHWNDRFRFLMLTNATKEEIAAEVKRTGLPENIVMAKFVSHSEIAAHLSLGDFGLNPVKPVPTKRYCTSIKDGEYWATGLPVVITRDISDDSGSLKTKALVMF
jgi:hypothetical protein